MKTPDESITHPSVPAVSIIIPAYKHASFIVETIDSVLCQSFRDFEIIVVNDGSPDDTEDVLRTYIEQRLIRYIRQENQGVATARNRGLASATGEFIAFLDDDDTWPPDKLEWQVRCLEQSAAVLVAGNLRAHGTADKDWGRDVGTHARLGLADFFKTNPFGSPGQTLIRRSALEQVGGFDPAIWGVDDLDLWMRLSSVGEIRKYDRLALFYRVHDANASLDLLRMAQNSEKVMVKNLATLEQRKRRKYTITAYRFLFRSAGKKLLWKGAQLIRQGRSPDGLTMIRLSFAIFLPRLARDPLLVLWYMLAIIKTPWKMRSIR